MLIWIWKIIENFMTSKTGSGVVNLKDCIGRRNRKETGTNP